MKIRLIIPIINNYNNYWIEDNYESILEERKNVLKIAMEESSIDLIVTSNNYFLFTYRKDEKLDIGKYINKIVLWGNMFLKKINCIVGFDMVEERKRIKGIKNGSKREGESIVAFFKVKNGKFEQETFIKECWMGRNDCSKECFREQNSKRIINVAGKKICLLSCGDIFSYCHKKGELLPNTDIYITLAHFSFRKWLVSNKKNPMISNIQGWKGDDKIVIITQILNRNEIRNFTNKHYFDENGNYFLIWPQRLRETQEIIYLDETGKQIDRNDNAKYILIDILL